MVDYRRRKELAKELSAAGYKAEMLDSWQPKVDLFYHEDKWNYAGDSIVNAKGSKLKNQPGHPEHVMNQARRGVLTYPPSDTCVCKFCNIESNENKLPRDTSGKFISNKTK
tara:strand:+ start:7671 stop:8003 length:333 start_codon:yes stop_codon:yes gene_type:complete